MSFFEELKRRNVFRVGVAYIVASWVLLQVAELVLEAIKAPEWVLLTMLMFVVLGFIAAMIIAWAYEMTPDGIKRESEVEREESITRETAARLDRITIGLLVAVVAIMLVERFVLEPTISSDPAQTQLAAPATPVLEQKELAATSANSIAVLPFVAISSGADDEYFADGLTEEILNALAQLPELLITARTSSFSFKGQDIQVQEIAEKLGVQNIVEGSVRRSGDRLRVTAQLVRAVDGFHVWSETYDSTSGDTIEVQEDIAEKIAVAMNVVMDEGKRETMRRSGLRDVEAFISLQKARELYQKAHGLDGDFTTLRGANRLYEEVLARVPAYPPALEEHADYYTHILNNDASGIAMPGVTAEEVASAQGLMLADISNALENARNFTEQNRMEIDLFFLSGNWRGIPTRIQRYLESSDCSEPTWSQQFAVPFMDAGAYADRIHQITECDPLSTTSWFNESRARVWAGDADEALRLALKGMEVAPGGWLPFAVNWALTAKGEFEELDNAIGKYFVQEDVILASHIHRLAAMGETKEIPALLAKLREQDVKSGFRDVMVSAHIGDLEATNHWAAIADQHPFGAQALLGLVIWCMCGAPWDLEVTPNFATALEEAGLTWPPPSPIKWPLKDW